MKSILKKLPNYNDLVLPYHLTQSVIAGVKYHFPARHLRVIGVTGTNGKTTTAFMIWQMLNHAGLQAGLMTTVAWGVNHLEPELGHMTTVDALTLNRRIKKIKDAGAEFLVLEVTSHALAQFRTLGIPIEIAVFTNLTHDHLDYHKTFARYKAAKGKLFGKAKFSILNADDRATEYYKKISEEYITYGIKSGENRAVDIKMSVSGVEYSCRDIGKVRINIPGEFNVYNSLAAALVGKKLRLSNQEITSGLASLKSVEGRMNLVDCGQPFTVIVDYAHAPDALEKVFEAVKGHKGRIISVHGGAGQRDPSTRPLRGAILAQHSDIVIITEDDTRDEDLNQIMASFAEGAKKHGKVEGKDLFLVPDRKDAIAKSFSLAKKGDLVLILGKGHEKTILRPDGPHPFEDIKVAESLLKKYKN